MPPLRNRTSVQNKSLLEDPCMQQWKRDNTSLPLIKYIYIYIYPPVEGRDRKAMYTWAHQDLLAACSSEPQGTMCLIPSPRVRIHTHVSDPRGVSLVVRWTFSLSLVLNVISNGIDINNVSVRLINFQWCSSPQGGFQSTFKIIYIWKSFFPKKCSHPCDRMWQLCSSAKLQQK